MKAKHQVAEIEQIRDYGLRVVFGNWAVLKNHPHFRDEFAQHRLEWVAHIGGKRESRRLLGDVILEHLEQLKTLMQRGVGRQEAPSSPQ